MHVVFLHGPPHFSSHDRAGCGGAPVAWPFSTTRFALGRFNLDLPAGDSEGQLLGVFLVRRCERVCASVVRWLFLWLSQIILHFVAKLVRRQNVFSQAEERKRGQKLRGRMSSSHAAAELSDSSAGIFAQAVVRRQRASVGKMSAKCCSFSAVSAPIFTRKYAFCSIFQNLQDYQAKFFEI